MTKSNIHIGRYFDDFLEEENILEESTSMAIKRILIWKILEEMKNQQLSKIDTVNKIHISLI